MAIIRLYDDDGDEGYPLVEVLDGHVHSFKLSLEKYKQHNEGWYNIDDFIQSLEDEDWFVRTIYADTDVFF